MLGRSLLLAGALLSLTAASAPPLRAETAGGTLQIRVSIGPRLALEGTGAAAESLDAGPTAAADGIPFQVRVRTNVPWRWSVRAESASGLAAPLQCAYTCRGIQTFGGAATGSGSVEVGPSARNLPVTPLPRGETMLEGRILLPPGTDPASAWNATLVWSVVQEPVSVGAPLTRTITSRLRGGEPAAAAETR